MKRHLGLCSVLLLAAATFMSQDVQIRTRVELVVVPVSVRNSDGKLVSGLALSDFSVFEDEKQQVITNFSIDPQPLSAAIVVDSGMGGNSLRRLSPLFTAVTGGFSAFDEMASFRYDHFVHQLSQFTNDPVQIEKSFEIVKKIAEKQPAQVPAGAPAPTAPKFLQLLLGALRNGVPAGGPPPEPGKPPLGGRPRPVPTSRVLLDALFDAGKALESRPADRRKILFIISDGQLAGDSKHSLDEVTSLLLKNNIQLFAVTTDYAVLEGRFGVLGSLAAVTGGETFRGSSSNGMETAFSKITEQARNQYVLGYHSNNESGPLPVHRRITVRARDPNWKVTYRRGYLQAPR